MDAYTRIVEQLYKIFSTAYGWFLAAIAATITFFRPEAWSFGVVAAALILDLAWGVAAARKMKKFILSKALRETFKKISIYGSALLIVFLAEMLLETSFLAIKATAVFAAACELWSMSASMLIVKPDMPFLRIFRLQLKGEIQSKLNKSIDFDDIFKEEKEDDNNIRGPRKRK